MVWPSLFKPFARLWLSFANIISNLGSKVALTIVFMLVVVPIAIIRRLMGVDAMRAGDWKNGELTAFLVCNQIYTKKDLNSPY